VSVFDKVKDVLDGRSDWRSELARRLALELDVEPNASMAKELRQLMAELEDEAAPKEGTALDELNARRARRATG
jgi:hypothetical protein